MIEIRDLEKSFGEIRALQHISLTIRDGELFGVVGTNGAGKSTLLRILAGVLRQEKGTVLVDGEPVFENEKIKSRICFLPDDLWFFHNAAPADMEDLYQNLYAAFDRKKFRQLCSRFGPGPQEKAADVLQRHAETDPRSFWESAPTRSICSATRPLTAWIPWSARR